MNNEATSFSSSTEKSSDYTVNSGWSGMESPRESDSGFKIVEQSYEDAQASRDEEDEKQDALIDQRVAEGSLYDGPGKRNAESLHLIIKPKEMGRAALETVIHLGIDGIAAGASSINPAVGAVAKKGADILKAGISVENR